MQKAALRADGVVSLHGPHGELLADVESADEAAGYPGVLINDLAPE